MAEQRKRALEVAVEQIAERGYDSVRFSDVAAAAGVSIGLLQHYFETRDALLSEAFEQHCNRLLERLDHLSVTETDPWRRIVRIVDELALDPGFHRRAAIWTDFCASSSRRVKLREPFGRVEAGWRRVVRAAVTEGFSRDLFRLALPLEDVVDVIVTLLDGATLNIAGGVSHMSGPRMHQMVLRTAATLLGMADPASADAARNGAEIWASAALD